MSVVYYLEKMNGDLFELGDSRTGWIECFCMCKGSYLPLPAQKPLEDILAIAADRHGAWEDGTDTDKVAALAAKNLHAWASWDFVTLHDDQEDCWWTDEALESAHAYNDAEE